MLTIGMSFFIIDFLLVQKAPNSQAFIFTNLVSAEQADTSLKTRSFSAAHTML
jgi:hypothetical protein